MACPRPKVRCKLRGRDWLPPQHWGHTPHIREFLKAVCLGNQVPVPPIEARRSLELAVAIYEAALYGKNVALPLGPDHIFYTGVEPGKVRAETREEEAACH